MTSDSPIILAFDLYGTVLSTSSIAKELSTHFGDAKAAEVASLWRRCQVEYTWRCNSMNIHIPFSTLTHRALLHALAEHGLTLSASSIESLLKAYDALSTFPDVGPALKTLASSPNYAPVIFSNGTTSMVTNSVQQSPDLSPHKDVFNDIVVVEEVQRFKPDPAVYEYLAKRMGSDMGRMWLISGNPFDVVGAKAMGMRAAWVDREGKGWTDGLMGNSVESGPDMIVQGLGEIVEGVQKFMEK